MHDMDELKSLLEKDGYTCVLSDGREIVTSRDRGVRPLVELIKSGKDYSGYIAADRTIGKAAALLYAKLGVTRVYAFVMSAGGVEVCKRHGIAAEYAALTDKIINRKGDDICPMEKTVMDIDAPDAAYEAICKRLVELSAHD